MNTSSSDSPNAPKAAVRPASVVVLIALAHFFHHLLTALLVPLLPFIRDDFGLTYAQSGLLISAFSLSYGFGQPPAGWLADRIGPRVLLLVGISGVALAGGVIGVSPGYGFLIAGLVLMGLLGGGYHPSASPTISSVVPAPRLGRALGFHMVGGSSSFFLAPLFGVFLAGLLGWRGAFLAIAGPVLLFGFLLYWILGHVKRRGLVGSTEQDSRKEDAEAEYPVPTLTVVLLLIVSTILSATVASLLAFVPLFIVDSFAATEQIAAAYLSVVYFAGLFAGPLGGYLADRLGPVRVILGVGGLLVPALLLLTVVPFGLTLGAVLLLIGALMVFRMPSAEAFLVGAVPRRLRSTMLGLYFFAGMEVGGLATPLVGHMIDRMGFAAGFRTVAIGSGVLLIIFGTALVRASRPLPNRG